MKTTNTTYECLEFYSGVLKSTIKSWRNEKVMGLSSAEAALGAFGFRLVPCPPLDSLSAATRAKLEEIGLDFRSDDEVLAAVIATFADAPRRRIGEGDEPAPRLEYRKPAWRLDGVPA